MKKNPSKLLLTLSLLVLLPKLASAHILLGTSHGFADGFLHPLTGWDHLLAMFAVGLWAAQHRGRAMWLIPSSFVGVMLLGGILGLAGVSVPGAQAAIALSVLALGGLVATMTRFRPSLSMMVVGLFALFHGYAARARNAGRRRRAAFQHRLCPLHRALARAGHRRRTGLAPAAARPALGRRGHRRILVLLFCRLNVPALCQTGNASRRKHPRSRTL